MCGLNSRLIIIANDLSAWLIIQNFPYPSVELSARVCSINSQICAIHVQAGIAGQECNRAHEILWASHLAHWDERSPLLLKLWVVIENLLGAARR